ncbi:MAG: LacI family DNA-binding transcriptional regulator [Candidatus Nanopelagicales bacterium]
MTQKRQATSITQVAAAAQVSIQTVSNAINYPDRVKPETRQRVLQAIQALDYTPNLAARRLRSIHTTSVAVRIDSNAVTESGARGLYAGFIQDEFVYQLTAAGERRGVKVVAYTAEDSEQEITQLKRLVNSRDADGIVLTSTVENDPRLDVLASMRVPFLSFGRPWGAENLYSPEHAWVDVDGGFGTAAATRMLWARGARRIAFIGWVMHRTVPGRMQSTAEDRRVGWVKALHELNPAFTAMTARKWEVLGEESVAKGREGARRLLSQHPDVEAIVCASDTLALGALLETTSAARSDVIICGFDNSPVSKEFGFSSIDQNLDQVADAALDVLTSVTSRVRRPTDQGQAEVAHVLLQPQLIER